MRYARFLVCETDTLVVITKHLGAHRMLDHRMLAEGHTEGLNASTGCLVMDWVMEVWFGAARKGEVLWQTAHAAELSRSCTWHTAHRLPTCAERKKWVHLGPGYESYRPTAAIPPVRPAETASRQLNRQRNEPCHNAIVSFSRGVRFSYTLHDGKSSHILPQSNRPAGNQYLDSKLQIPKPCPCSPTGETFFSHRPVTANVSKGHHDLKAAPTPGLR
jgi:hypothetical protein